MSGYTQRLYVSGVIFLFSLILSGSVRDKNFVPCLFLHIDIDLLLLSNANKIPI